MAKLNFPTSMNLSSDLCLAQVINNTNLTCVNRTIQVKDNWARFPFLESGVYSIIFNPCIQLKLGYSVDTDLSTLPEFEDDDFWDLIKPDISETNSTEPASLNDTNVANSTDGISIGNVDECDGDFWCKSRKFIIIFAACLVACFIVALVLIFIKARQVKTQMKLDGTLMDGRHAAEEYQNFDYSIQTDE